MKSVKNKVQFQVRDKVETQVWSQDRERKISSQVWWQASDPVTEQVGWQASDPVTEQVDYEIS